MVWLDCDVGNLNVWDCRLGLVGSTSYIHLKCKFSLVFREQKLV
jgi:hypothetical protein